MSHTPDLDTASLLVDGQPDRDLAPDILNVLSAFNAEVSTLTRKTVDDTQALRVQFHLPDYGSHAPQLHRQLRKLAAPHAISFSLRQSRDPLKIAVMVSRPDHCLRRLLAESRDGSLQVEITRVVSNHPDTASLVQAADIPFHHIPVDEDTKYTAEAEQLRVLSGSCELLVLARYMQILSVGFLKAVGVPVVNLHHSLLPAFPGANPYRQAHERGVKLLGATAHFATPDLDEGPIIAQGADQVIDDTESPAQLARRGRRLEADVLARAVALVSQDRVVPTISGKTIIF